MASRYTKVETITREQYVQLVGLLALGQHYGELIQGIERAACLITGERPESSGHTLDAIYNDYSAERLLELLSITVQDAPSAAANA